MLSLSFRHFLHTIRNHSFEVNFDKILMALEVETDWLQPIVSPLKMAAVVDHNMLFQKLLNLLSADDKNVEVDDTGLTSLRHGVGSYSPNRRDDPSGPVESIIVFSKGLLRLCVPCAFYCDLRVTLAVVYELPSQLKVS